MLQRITVRDWKPVVTRPIHGYSSSCVETVIAKTAHEDVVIKRLCKSGLKRI
jgi:hypothetical protein